MKVETIKRTAIKRKDGEKGAAMVMVLFISSLMLTASIGLLLETSLNSANVAYSGQDVVAPNIIIPPVGTSNNTNFNIVKTALDGLGKNSRSGCRSARQYYAGNARLVTKYAELRYGYSKLERRGNLFKRLLHCRTNTG